MEKCVSCKKVALMPSVIGKMTFCQSCALKLNTNSWKNRIFSSKDELTEKKITTLSSAKENGMSSESLEMINYYFEEYSDKGFFAAVNGKSSQTIKVFNDYLIVDTKDSMASNALSNISYCLDDDDDDDDEVDFFSILSSEKSNIMKGVMSGKFVQTGLSFATAAVIDQKEKTSERKSRERHKNIDRLVTMGELKINYKNLDHVSIYSSNSAYGCLIFVPNGVSEKDFYACQYFVFDNSRPLESKKIRQKLEQIKEFINDKIEEIKENKRQIEAKEKADAIKAEKEQQIKVLEQPKQSPFEEIRMYKELLDEGIITQEEFNLKKKEILGL